MWSRRRFLENISALPLVGGVTAVGAVPAAAATSRKGRDYFRDLGVRPFINAAGTYTAMTASLMPPEVMEAIHYASKHYVMLDELHDRVGQRIATLVRKTFGVRYHPSHLWRVLRGCGWSCQVPERRAIQRDEEAIAHWMRYTWPAIKKSAKAWRPHRLPR